MIDFGKILAELPGQYQHAQRNKDHWICCPFHSEKTPSLRIHGEQTPEYQMGDFYCFGCHAHGGWNDLAPALGMKKMRFLAEMQRGTAFKMRNNEPTQLLPYQTLPRWPDNMAWRTISGKTVQQSEGRLIVVRRQPWLYFPILVHDEYVGGIYARLDKSSDKKQSSYVNTEGEWAANALINFNDAVEKDGPLWVVEGPRDTFHLKQNNCRVVGLIGSAVTKAKIRLIKELDPECIVCATDPDQAGKKAYDKLKKELGQYFKIKRLNMPENTDPVDLTPKQIKKVNQLAQ